jgi:tryptophan 7-halogenase
MAFGFLGERKLARVAVVGGGTAGFMAAATMTRHFGDVELFHIYDPAIPIIGVGEGTLTTFPGWLKEVTALSEEELRHRCGMTRKYGITFENWGQAHRVFHHHFYPPERAWAYHISAPRIVKLLADHVSATTIHKRVTALDSDGRQVSIRLDDGGELTVDFAFDARGFPPQDSEGVCPLPVIPTNAALVKGAPPVAFARPEDTTTRAVARPHGWVFVIPLVTRTAYGYVYNAALSTPEQVEADLDELLAEDGLTALPGVHHLRFPNFTRRRFFDGALFSIGNRASFLEPLEATTIGFAHTQIEAARRWPLSQWRYYPPDSEELKARNLETLNRFLFRYGQKIGLFVGWHYSQGSRFQSAFWDFARENFQRQRELMPDPAVTADFDHFIASASRYSSFAEFPSGLGDDGRSLFGIWPLASFVEMRCGLGLAGGVTEAALAP